MRPTLRSSGTTLATLVIAGAATAALAQRFVWPPAAGDKQPPYPSERVEAASATEPLAVDPQRVASAGPSLTVGSRTDVQVAPAAPSGAGPIEWRILENPNGPHTACVFDPVRQVFAVYHVDSASGQIMLKSVRNLSADLRLDQFNSSNPAPKDIQSMLDEAR